MIYDDGVLMDENMKAVCCPRCNNEQFNNDAHHCCICGLMLYNLCEGIDKFDDYGNYLDKNIRHINPGNARFCETCGAKTLYFNENILQPYDEVRENYVEDFLKNRLKVDQDGGYMFIGGQHQNPFTFDDDNGLPF